MKAHLDFVPKQTMKDVFDVSNHGLQGRCNTGQHFQSSSLTRLGKLFVKG